MWYSSPSISPPVQVSPSEMSANVETDFRTTGHVAAAAGSPEPDFGANGATPVKAAAASGPGTEYWLP
jgi:hypothetical protein